MLIEHAFDEDVCNVGRFPKWISKILFNCNVLLVYVELLNRMRLMVLIASSRIKTMEIAIYRPCAFSGPLAFVASGKMVVLLK